MRSVRNLYHSQKSDAKRRGIEFKLTFEEWTKWWQDNAGQDWLNKRGRGIGKYVMARFGDSGPYELGNIKCITGSENSAEVKRGPNSSNKSRNSSNKSRPPFNRKVIKLTAADAKLIHASTETQNALARHYKVSARLIRMIKNKQVWKYTLDDSRGSF